MSPTTIDLDDFLSPLHIDANLVLELARELAWTFGRLSANSLDQFLPTPISESMLRPVVGREGGRFLAIDIGGTNLRVGFVELLGSSSSNGVASPLLVNGDQAPTTGEKDTRQTNGVHSSPEGAVPQRLNRLLEHSWPIQDHLKNENSESLFAWIGDQVAHVVRKGCSAFHLPPDEPLPMGVTFSFPMKQSSLSEATLMAMGKGFAITSDLDLGGHLLRGYEKYRTANMPPIHIAAISNDAVSTLVSFIYQFPVAGAHQKAAMGLIVGTGSNATIPLKLSSLHPSKRPAAISVLPGQDVDEVMIAVNTEWSINGSAPPLRKLGLISRWDEQLDRAGEAPGFQPLEYMTAGRYLGELARLIFVDYISAVHGVETAVRLPERLRQRFGLSTTFISRFYPKSPEGCILKRLEDEFPLNAVDSDEQGSFRWTEELAHVLYRISHAIEVRAAGIIAASTVGLLSCAGEIPSWADGGVGNGDVDGGLVKELAVGYTGGCIQYFQNYLADTQRFIDGILEMQFEGQRPPVKVLLSPCHDGGITGAGILVPAALASESA